MAGEEACDLAALLQRDGDRFIKTAYAVLLGREPDPDGWRNFRGRLRDGVAKLRILEEIVGSPEGRAKAADLAGLQRGLRKMRLASLPLIGGMLGSLLRVEGDAPKDRRLRALVHQVRELRETTLPGMRRVQHALDRMREKARRPAPASAPESWQEQRAQLVAEHSADRKVWAIEQAEAKRFIDSLQERSATAEEYARSLEHERAHWRALQEVERAARETAEQRAARLAGQLERLGIDESMVRK